jgi:hypothetical protein
MPLTYNVMPFPKFFAVNASGTPYAGGKLYSYAAGLVTPQDTYSDAIGTPNTNPVILDSAGRATVYLAPTAYSFELKDANNVSIWTADPIYGFSLTQNYGLAGGRLTLTSTTPVTTPDVTGASAATIYYTPYSGGQIALPDSTGVWGAYTFNEISIAVPAVANQMYDVFASQTAGVVSLSLVAWTSDTARATAITRQNGVWVKSGGTSFKYLGSIRTTAVAGQVEDSFAKRYVWNVYNRVPRVCRVLEATDTWAYSLAVLRQANAAAGNQLDVVVGVAEEPITVEVVGSASSDALTDQFLVAIGEDSTTAMKSGCIAVRVSANVANLLNAPRALLRTYPAVGRHVYTWLEYTAAVGTTTWRGDNGQPTILQSGIHGVING